MKRKSWRAPLSRSSPSACKALFSRRRTLSTASLRCLETWNLSWTILACGTGLGSDLPIYATHVQADRVNGRTHLLGQRLPRAVRQRLHRDPSSLRALSSSGDRPHKGARRSFARQEKFFSSMPTILRPSKTRASSPRSTARSMIWCAACPLSGHQLASRLHAATGQQHLDSESLKGQRKASVRSRPRHLHLQHPVLRAVRPRHPAIESPSQIPSHPGAATASLRPHHTANNFAHIAGTALRFPPISPPTSTVPATWAQSASVLKLLMRLMRRTGKT